MNLSRRSFLESALAAAAAPAISGCCSCCRGAKPRVALQLYSIRTYIGGVKDRKTGRLLKPGVGLEKALEDVAKLGYAGVEFAGYYGFKSAELKKMLADNGLVACGDHVGGWRNIEGDNLKRVAEFNLGFGNNVLICPGGTGPDGMNWGNPKWDAACDKHMKFIVDFYNKAAETAKTMGCRVGIHNHQWEFKLKDPNGVTFWDRFFGGTTPDVIMEQDVGWTTCAGYDPCEQYKKYPHRSPTLHAKENGMGSKGPFDAILGRPGEGAVGVDWDRLAQAANADGVKWWVVECEKHEDTLDAVRPSVDFLRAKGIC